MDNEVVISVEDLGKRYNLGLVHRDRLADALKSGAHWIASGWRRLVSGGSAARPVNGAGPTQTAPEHIWALRNVTFDVRRGDVLGVIGKNGAGKSTLLKILTRLTEPTEGRARIHGRVASLLEVGTGFHPELTGQENVFLNGSILGMTRRETRARYSEIVDFAEIGDFIDTPVKRYSSGMYVRLAFAVAAHLQPEILLVDEVLAVGDYAFQKKCLGKMEDVSRKGRTVLFVSHNMNAVRALCPQTILIEKGRVAFAGETEGAVSQYLGDTTTLRNRAVLPPGERQAYFAEAMICDEQGLPSATFPFTSPIKLVFRYIVKEPIRGLAVSLALYDRDTTKIFETFQPPTALGPEQEPFPRGEYAAEVTIPGGLVAPGKYTISAGLHRLTTRVFDARPHVLRFEVLETGSRPYPYPGQHVGSVLVGFPWEVRRTDS